jgi:hypothetical protein
MLIDQVHGDRWSRCLTQSVRYSGLDLSANVRHVHVSACRYDTGSRLMPRAAIRHSVFSSDGELIAIAGDDPHITIVRI